MTGERSELPPDLAATAARVRSATTLPLCVGFGISRPEQARAVARMADGVVVGSAMVRAAGESVEAALALGANPWETVRRVLFPAARNGLLAACMLGMGRAVGETMAVLMATGHNNRIPQALTDPVRTITATIAAEMGETSFGDDHYRVLFILGIVLFVITCGINVAADLIVKGVKKANKV